MGSGSGTLGLTRDRIVSRSWKPTIGFPAHRDAISSGVGAISEVSKKPAMRKMCEGRSVCGTTDTAVLVALGCWPLPIPPPSVLAPSFSICSAMIDRSSLASRRALRIM